MLKPLIRRQFLWTVVIFAAVLYGTNAVTRLVFSRERGDFLQHHLMIYKYAAENSPKGVRAAVAELNAVNQRSGSPVRLEFAPDDGHPIPSLEDQKRLPGPPFREVELGGAENLRLIARLGPPPDGHNPALMTGMIFLAIALASFLSVVFFFWRFREKAEVAKSVLSRMQQGDLKARFPTSRWDDASQILGLFNQMADEIERLVESLRDNETARMHLLQDLAHDLRTPVASLRNLIEGLNDESQPLDPAARRELTSLAFQETEYLTKLVEDLLFLALVIEPKYKSESNEIAICDLLENQLTAVASNYPRIEISHLEGDGPRPLITGNPQLLTRLLRNGLDNAASFASRRLTVGAKTAGDFIELTIRDDGPGFTPEALENFGKKRATRYMAAGKQDGRISVGLGTVIMQAIAFAHGGAVSARNLPEGGSEIKIKLRKSFEPAVPA
jgi:signal transduction histidine kinase